MSSSCGQPTINTSQGCYIAAGSSQGVTVDIIRTFMPDPNNLGKTILTETRYVKPTATGPMPFVPNFAGGDVVEAGACPLPQVLTAAPGELQSAWYDFGGGSVAAIKITTETDSQGNIIAVHGYSLPTLAPIPSFNQANLVTRPACPTPTNTGVNPSW